MQLRVARVRLLGSVDHFGATLFSMCVSLVIAWRFLTGINRRGSRGSRRGRRVVIVIYDSPNPFAQVKNVEVQNQRKPTIRQPQIS